VFLAICANPHGSVGSDPSAPYNNILSLSLEIPGLG